MTTARRGRVAASHSIARRSFAAAGVFAFVAVAWSIVVLTRGGSWWGPLHAYVAGTVLFLISGASQMFTITWATSTAPPPWVTRSQRWFLGLGVTGALIGVTRGIDWLVWAGAGAVVVAIALLAAAIGITVRRSLLRRFDLSARFYLLAFATGVLGVTLGAILGSGMASTRYVDLRLVHFHLNLMGLVGMTIIGTLPTFLPTTAHHKAVSGREAQASWWLAVVGLALIASGVVLPPETIGLGTLVVAAAGATIVGGIVGRLWRKGRTRLPFIQVTLGVSWLVAWTIVDGVTLITGQIPAMFSAWTLAAVLSGVGQVVGGALAYMVPVLMGPPLPDNTTRLTSRPWVPLVTANLLGGAALLGLPGLATVAGAVWVADLGRRLVSVLANQLRRDRPDAPTPSRTQQ